MLLLFVLTLIQCFAITRSILPYKIVKLDSPKNQSIFLVFNGKAKLISDQATVASLGFKDQTLEIISMHDLNALHAGTPVPTIKCADSTPDELTRVEILKSTVIMGNIVFDDRFIGDYMNPSIVKWQEWLLLMTGSNDGRANTKTTKQALLEFRWLNDTSFPFFDTAKRLGEHRIWRG